LQKWHRPEACPGEKAAAHTGIYKKSGPGRTILDHVAQRLRPVHRHTAELGYWLGEEFWARGVMTEAVGAFTDFCFDRFLLRRIYAEPFANNRASARVLEKAGFSFEGRLKNNVLKNGELLDSLLYARTK